MVKIANKHDIAIVSVNEHIDTGSASGRMMVNLLMVISQWERETIGERTQAALQYKRNNGLTYNGVALYGFKNSEGYLVPEESEQKIIDYVMDLNKMGIKVASICRKLRGRGYKTRKGNDKWYSTVVRKVIDDSPVRRSILEGIKKNT